MIGVWQIFFSYQTLLCRDEGVGGEQASYLFSSGDLLPERRRRCSKTQFSDEL